MEEQNYNQIDIVLNNGFEQKKEEKEKEARGEDKSDKRPSLKKRLEEKKEQVAGEPGKPVPEKDKDNDHCVVGTSFKFQVDVKGEPLQHFLARQLTPDVGFSFEEITLENKRVVVLIIPAVQKVPTAFAGIRYIRIGSSKENIMKYPERESQLFYVLRNGFPSVSNTEAVINAFVHNKWVDDNGPMFTCFRGRIEILSRGTLSPKQTVDGFYAGESVPVNEALSKIFIQLHITEHTGRGIPQITSLYGRDNIRIKENNIVVTIPFDRLEDETYASTGGMNVPVKGEIPQDSIEEKIIKFCHEPRTASEIADYLNYKDKKSLRKYLNPLLEIGRIAMTVPDKPNSKNQKYIAIK